jgi:molybdopterin-guanine dinucleotide biosynthesis protein
MFDPHDLIAALDDARIDYVIIGGFAVARAR